MPSGMSFLLALTHIEIDIFPSLNRSLRQYGILHDERQRTNHKSHHTAAARPALKVILTGGGIGGFTAAIALRQQGHDVEVSPAPHSTSLGTIYRF